MRLRTALATIGVGLVLFVTTDAVTFAATGSSLVLGRINVANATTTIQNTGASPALRLVTNSSATAPLVVNGKGRVANLYADRATTADNAAKLGGKTLAQVNAAATTHLSWAATGSGGVLLGHSPDLTMTFVGNGAWCATVAGIDLQALNNAGITATPITRYDSTKLGGVSPRSTHVEIDALAGVVCPRGAFVFTYTVDEIAKTSDYTDSGFELTIIH